MRVTFIVKRGLVSKTPSPFYNKKTSALMQRLQFVSCLFAEREGFEPPVQLPVHRISSAARSTTPAPLLVLPFSISECKYIDNFLIQTNLTHFFSFIYQIRRVLPLWNSFCRDFIRRFWVGNDDGQRYCCTISAASST